MTGRAPRGEPRFRRLELLPTFAIRRVSEDRWVMLSGPEEHVLRGRRRRVWVVRLGVDARGTARGGFCPHDTEEEARAHFRRKTIPGNFTRELILRAGLVQYTNGGAR